MASPASVLSRPRAVPLPWQLILSVAAAVVAVVAEEVVVEVVVRDQSDLPIKCLSHEPET